MITEFGFFQVLIYLFAVLVLVKPLGWYIAQIYEGKPCGLNRVLESSEHFIYRLCGIIADEEMTWKSYVSAMLIFNFFGFLFVYALQRLQIYLPFNPEHFSAVPSDLAFNTATSFVTNTDWQAYAGETTLSYWTQMTALTVQNFLSAATGLSLLMALIRGLRQHENSNLGNFWVDTVRGVIYILLPLAFVFSMILVSQGVIQNFKPYAQINTLEAKPYQLETIAMGPVASQVAIKQLGSNGGGFFKANSAHPFENPTPLSNFLEMLAILLIPAALCYTFGLMVNDKPQGWSIFVAMLLMFIFSMGICIFAEEQENPAFGQMGIERTGNMEGKETRVGIVGSALWMTATTATSNGSVNAMHDSFTPLGGLVPLWLMHLGEVVFGGVGSGLYGMLVLIIMTVFIAGLMVGRTPEYLGKKIESYEMKMAAVAVLIMPLIVLLLTALATMTNAGRSAVSNPGTHGFNQILYAMTSMGNNNGSAAGLNANTPFYTIWGGIAMLIGRYWIAIPVLAIAGSLARKKIIPSSSGTLTTYTPLFIILLISVTLVLGALSFFPALSLGPIAELIQ